MSAELRESFDHYDQTTSGEMGWTSAFSLPLRFAAGRTGGQSACPFVNNTAAMALPSGGTGQPKIIMGVAFNNAWGYANRILFSFDNLGLPQIVVKLNANGGFDVGTGISVFSGGGALTNFLGRTPNTLYGATGWTHVQLKATAAIGSGSFELVVNSVSVLVMSGVSTILTASDKYATIALQNYSPINSAQDVLFDDLYVNNGLGTAHNDFEGDIKIACFLPTADGFHHDWTPLTGSPHYPMVNEQLVDNDATYVSTAGVGNMDTYTFAPLALPTGGHIVDIQAVAIVRKDDAGAHTVSLMVRQGGADTFATAVPVMNSYNGIRKVWELDPSGAAWTPATVNAAEFGEKLAT